MTERREQGLVCDKCLETSPTKKQLVSIECFNFKEHRQKRRLVRVQWTGSRFVEVSRRSKSSADTGSRARLSSGRIRPMPDVPDLKGRFILCDRARCKGEQCTHPHSVEERDAWNEELLGTGAERKRRITVEFQKLLRNFPNNEIPLKTFQQNYQTFYHKSFRVSDFISDTDAGVRELVSQCDGIQVQVKTIKGRKESIVCLSTSLAAMKQDNKPQGTSNDSDEKNPHLQVKGNEPEWPSLGANPQQQGSKGPLSAWSKPLQSKIGANIVTNKENVPTVKGATRRNAQPQRDREPLPLKSGPRGIPQSSALPRQEKTTIPSKSKMGVPQARVDSGSASQEFISNDPIEFPFLEGKEDASHTSHGLVFHSQPVEELSPSLHLSTHGNSTGQLGASQPDPKLGYLTLDDPSIISHSQGNGGLVVDGKTTLPMETSTQQINWPDFEAMPVSTTYVQGIAGATILTNSVNTQHGLLQAPINMGGYNASATVPGLASIFSGSMSQPAPSTIHQHTHSMQVQSLPLNDMGSQGLSQSNYKDVLKLCLNKEQTVHKTELSKCDGEYTMYLYKQGYKPRWLYDNEADQVGYINGIKGGYISYCTQASQWAVISGIKTPHKEIFRAKIPRSNLSNFEESLYIALDSDNCTKVMNSLPNVTKPQQVYVSFKSKDSYFYTLKQSVDFLPVEIIRRIVPDDSHFRNHPVSNFVENLGECERYCHPDHGQLSALRTIVSCPSDGPPVLIVGPFGAGKSRILAVAALYFMQTGNGVSPCRVLVCMQQRASVESFIGCFSSLIASKQGMEIWVVQNYGKPRNESVKKWYISVDDLKQRYRNGLTYQRPFLVITTCITSRSLRFLPRGFFTHIMLDEAAQMREPENITPLCLATPNTKIVVAGDPNQVGPETLVLGNKTQLSTSLLERLVSIYDQLGSLSSNYLVTLMNNYRCHESILQLVGELYYDYPLMWPDQQPPPSLHPDAPYPLIFICSSVDEMDDRTSTVHRREAEIVLEELIDKAKRWPAAWRDVDLSQFCVMSPNRSQMNLIQKIIKEKKLSNQLESLTFLTTIDIQGQEYRGIFLSTSEPIEEDDSSTDHRRSLADRYVFNTAITRAQSLVVSVGNPFLLLRLEKHMLQRYGEKGKCWSSYLKHCMEMGTLRFDKFLGLTTDDEASCTSKIQLLVEEQYRIADEMVEKESLIGRIPLKKPENQPQKLHTAQIPGAFSLQPTQQFEPQGVPQSTLSQVNPQPSLECQPFHQNIQYSSQSMSPSAYSFQPEQFTTNTGHGLQPNQSMMQPSNLTPHLHATNSGIQAMQANHPYPAFVNNQPHMQAQNPQQGQLPQSLSQTNLVPPFDTSYGQHQPAMPYLPSEPKHQSLALDPYGVVHHEEQCQTFSQHVTTDSQFPLTSSTKPQEEITVSLVNPSTDTTDAPCRIYACNITERYDKMFIHFYFESPSSGGGKVTNVEMLGSGAAVITFQDPDVIETVLLKRHTLFGPNATVTKYCDHFTPNPINIQPAGVHEAIASASEQCIDSVTITQEENTKVAEEPVAIGTVASIWLSNVTKHYDHDYIELYFEQFTPSVQVEMKGNGDAVIHFDKPEDIEAALQGKLDKFGEKVTLERILQNQEQDLKAHITQIEVSVQELKAKCLAKNPGGLEEHLSELHVKVTVDAGQGKVFATPTNLTKAEWQEEGKEQINTYIKSKLFARTKKTQLANSSEGIAELKEYVHQLSESACFVYEFKKENAQIRIAGDDDSVKRCEAKLKEIVDGFKMVEDDVSLSRESYDYLKRIKLSEIKSKFPEVSVVEDPKSPALKLKGKQKAVQKFKTTLVEDRVHKTLPVHVDDLVVNYFQTKKGKFLLKEVLKDSACQVLPRFLTCDQTSNVTLNLICDPSQELAASKVVESLQQATDVQRITLPESLVAIQEEVDEEYTSLCKSFEEKYSVVVKHFDKCIAIVGKREDVEQSTFEIGSFIKQKCTVKEEIRFEVSVWKLLTKHMNEKWANISSQCTKEEVQLMSPQISEKSKLKATVHVILTGFRVPVKMLCDTINGLLQGICREIIYIDHPGTSKFFHSKKSTTRALHSIETEKKVVIEVVDPNKAAEPEDSETESDTPATCQHSRKFLAPLDNGKQIMIFIGDITEFTQADVIVNAANISLEHYGGVAKAISDKGGPIIQRESRLHVKQNGKLQTGEVWLTNKAGGLPCKALVHAVGPIWVDGKRNEEALLVNACLNTLKAVHDNGYCSVALPAISAGIYNYPMDKCAQVMLHSIIQFNRDHPSTSIQDYYIILLKNENALTFIATLKQLLQPAGAKQDSIAPKQAKPKQAWSVPAKQQDPHSKDQTLFSDTNVSSRNEPMHYPSVSEVERKKPSQPTFDQTKSKVLECIQLHKGSILDMKADIYVNTTDRNLNLSNGAVSKILLREGGEELQLECSRKAPIRQFGEIITTDGHNLKCRYVLHTALPNYDSGAAEVILRRAVRKCMLKCQQLGVRSIAFPAIGTGNLGYPDEFVAKIMIHEISQYLLLSPVKIVVHLVIFMAHTHAAFKKELQSLEASLKQQKQLQITLSPKIISEQKKPHTPDTTRDQDNMATPAALIPPTATDRKSAPSSARTQNAGRVLLPTPSQDSPPPAAVQSTNKQTVTYYSGGQLFPVTIIVNGDITKEISDVIVNCTNSRSKLGMQGVAGALQRRAGPLLEKLFDKELEKSHQFLGGNRIIETQATGDLKCKSVFHVHFNRQTPDGFVQLVTACLQRAQDRGYSTISFPAIGTGGGGYPPEAAASGMLKAIKEFSDQQPPRVKSIRIVLFNNPSLLSTFVKTFNPSRQVTAVSHNLPSTGELETAPLLETESSNSHSEDEIPSIPIPGYLEEDEQPSSIDLEHSSETEEQLAESDIEIEKLEIKIFGENEEVVKAVKKEVEDMIDEHLVEDSIEISSTEKLPKAVRRDLIREGKQHNVRIVVDEDFGHTIQLSGYKDDVAKVKLYIIKALTQVKEKMTREHAAKSLYQIIRWKKIDSTKSEYDQETNYAIEMAYKDHDSQPKYSHGTSQTSLYFTIDFDQMEEIDHHANDTCIKVVRVNMEVEEQLKKVVHDYPSHWSQMPLDSSTGKEQAVFSVTLDPSSDEYQEIISEFNRTMTGGQRYSTYGSYYSQMRRYHSGSSYGSIVKLLRIQNPGLYATYLAKKKSMEKQSTSDSVIERRLFHGTAGDICSKINRDGFNRSFAGKHATAYGQGVYFARDANYSASNTYSLPDRRGHKHVYYARVLTGDYTTGSSSMKEPPLKEPWSESSSRYDSVANTSDQDPSIFVIFNDTSAYPEYLIVFTLL